MSAEDFISRLITITSNKPECFNEECIIEWTIKCTQNIQAIFDEATDVLEGTELKKVERLYQHKLEEVFNAAMAMLGAQEV